MVTHMVLFKFDRPEDAEEVRQRLLAMAGQVPSLLGIEVGLDFTRSERSYELGLITRHRDREALSAYRTHPVHLEVAALIRDKSQGAVAVDFESPD